MHILIKDVTGVSCGLATYHSVFHVLAESYMIRRDGEVSEWKNDCHTCAIGVAVVSYI